MENTSHECRDKLKQELVEVCVKQETSICRGCLTTEQRMVNAMVLDALYRDLTGITISPTDGLPQWLCYECSALLHKYNRFRSKVIKSHHKLCQYVLESVPFAVNEDATPHLSRTSVRHCHIAGVLTDKLEEHDDDTVKYDNDMLCETVEDVKVKDEPIFSDYEENIKEEEYREESPQFQLERSVPTSNLFDINVTVKHEEQAEEGEASSQEPHVGTEAAQQHLNKHVDLKSHPAPTLHRLASCGAFRTWRHYMERQQLADTNSTRRSDDTEEELKHNIRREDSVSSSSRSNIQSYICDACNKCFSDKKLLITHIREHSAEKLFKCDDKDFLDESALSKHSHVHTAAKLYQCDVSYKCDICKKSFGRKQHLTSHLRMHTGDKPYKCEICMKCFGRKQHLTCHMRVHTGEKPYKCEICMKCFGRKQHLTCHMRMHSGDQPYKCNVCMKCFGQKSNLNNHMKVHTGEKPYKCDVCMKLFSQKGDLNKHIRVHTGDKPYKCDVCIKLFSQKGDLNKHMRVHTGDKPYKCDVCFKLFSQKQHIKLHMRVHTGDKPYKCNVCMKCFSRKGHLNKHMQMHTGEKPYKCDV